MIRPLKLAMLLLCSIGAAAQEKPPRIFSGDAILDVRIEAPWNDVMRNKESGDSWDGTFRYTEASGRAVSIPVTITTRGITRLRVCDFPPLRIGFDKAAAKGTAFRGAGNLKLVTHCSHQSDYEQYSIKEYLAYRIYNLVTDKSFRVQGLDVSYERDADDRRPIRRFAFLIEDPDDVAERNGMLKLMIEDTLPERLDPVEAARFALFQYFIGNLDWSALGGPKPRCCHNARLIGASPEDPPFVAIPYDLDSSGIVDAEYAGPPPGIKVRNVRHRLYRGFCVHNEELPTVLDEFRELRPQFEALFEDEKRLDNRVRKKALHYIRGFYGKLETDDDVRHELIENCRG